MATQKRTSGKSTKKSQSKAGAVSRRASLKAAPQRRKRSPARVSAAASAVSKPSSRRKVTASKVSTAKTASASRTGRKAGMIKKALNKGFAELAKVGS